MKPSRQAVARDPEGGNGNRGQRLTSAFGAVRGTGLRSPGTSPSERVAGAFAFAGSRKREREGKTEKGGKDLEIL